MEVSGSNCWILWTPRKKAWLTQGHTKEPRGEKERISGCVYVPDKGFLLHHCGDRGHTTLFGKKARGSFHIPVLSFEGRNSKASLSPSLFLSLFF